MDWLRGVARHVAHQEWLRFGVRYRLAAAVMDPDSSPSEEFEVDFFGHRYPGNFSSYIDWSAFFFGAYERSYLGLLKSLVEPLDGVVFVDVGANVGHHSLFMSSYCETVHAFEPNPRVGREIRRKVELNGLTNVHIHEFGLGVAPASLPFFLPAGANQGTGSFVEGYSDNNLERTTLRVERGDDWARDQGLARLDLIKVDVEGFERQVLEGLHDTLRRFRPLIAMEWSPSTQASFESRDAFMATLPQDYQVRRVAYDEKRWVMLNSPKACARSFDFDRVGGDLLAFPDAAAPRLATLLG